MARWKGPSPTGLVLGQPLACVGFNGTAGLGGPFIRMTQTIKEVPGGPQELSFLP